MKDLYYIDGRATRYSMGLPVYACCASMVIHFGMILALFAVRYKTIEQKKRSGILLCILTACGVLICQILCCYREAMPPETCFAIIENGAGFVLLRFCEIMMKTRYGVIILS